MHTQELGKENTTKINTWEKGADQTPLIIRHYWVNHNISRFSQQLVQLILLVPLATLV